MTTMLGKFLRKLRVDKDETQKDMSIKLGVSSAFLYLIENGKRNANEAFLQKIVKIYTLTKEQEYELIEAAALSKRNIKIDMSNVSTNKRAMAWLFAKKFTHLNDRQICEIKQILEEMSK